jgi:hypothetical protein
LAQANTRHIAKSKTFITIPQSICHCGKLLVESFGPEEASSGLAEKFACASGGVISGI